MERSSENNAMNFERVMKLLVDFLSESRIPYTFIGAIALGFLGYPRATEDVDLLVKKDDMPVIRRFMEGIGYVVYNQTDNVTQFSHHLAVFGSVDFLHAFRELASGMLERAQEISGSGSVKYMVVQPEDLIGLKLQSMRNNPLRKARDIADITELVFIHGSSLDWKTIGLYAKVLEMEDVIDEVRKSTTSE